MLLHPCASLALTRPIAVVASVQDNRGQLKDLFAPEIRRTTLLLSLLWSGLVFLSAFSFYSHLRMP